MAVLFYRGIVLAGLCWMIQAILVSLFYYTTKLRSFFNFRDIFCVCALTFSFNITFLIIFPVTLERSVSTFLLSQLALQQEDGLSQVEMEILLKKEYIDNNEAVPKRMKEQILTGNVAVSGEKFVLTNQGQNFLKAGETIKQLYGLKDQKR